MLANRKSEVSQMDTQLSKTLMIPVSDVIAVHMVRIDLNENMRSAQDYTNI